MWEWMRKWWSREPLMRSKEVLERVKRSCSLKRPAEIAVRSSA